MSAKSWESILVAVRDPAAHKQMALRKAARIASLCGARLTLFHAFALPLPASTATALDSEEIIAAFAKQRREELMKLAHPLRLKGIDVDCEAVWDFPAAHAIVRRVYAAKPDLVVAESHRHSRVARWFLANSDWDLIRECPCPVWFVKNERLSKSSLLLTAVDPTHAHAKPSALDDELLRAASAVAQQVGGRVALIHVDATAPSTPKFALQRLQDAASQAVSTVAVDAVERLAKRHALPDAARVLRRGVPAQVLTDSAAALKADVLVMGAVSRSGLSHSHIGNTAEAVIDHVACDVLVVKPRRFKSAVPRQPPKLPASAAAPGRKRRARR